MPHVRTAAPALPRRGFLAAGLAAPAALAAARPFHAADACWAAELRPAAAGGAAPVARILFNENPLGPPPAAVAAAAEACGGANRYPFAEAGRLSMELRERHGMPTAAADPADARGTFAVPGADAELLLGVGSTELLRAVAAAYLGGGGTLVEADPSYRALGEAAAAMNPAVRRVRVPCDAAARVDLTAMREAVGARPETRVVLVVNPNNPTGTALPAADVEDFARSLPGDVLLLIDEAYVEFAADPAVKTAVPLALSRPNVLVTRTFSKLFGLAGYRVGYGVASGGVAARLRPHLIGSIAFNAPGVAAARAALADADYRARSRAHAAAVRGRLADSLPGSGLTVADSQAGFVWADVGPDGPDAGDLTRFLAARGVLVSPGGPRWDAPRKVRISVGTEAETDRLIAGVAAWRAAA